MNLNPATVLDPVFDFLDWIISEWGVYQQIRGNCSPESMSTTRVPPTRVFIVTMPG